MLTYANWLPTRIRHDICQPLSRPIARRTRRIHCGRHSGAFRPCPSQPPTAIAKRRQHLQTTVYPCVINLFDDVPTADALSCHRATVLPCRRANTAAHGRAASLRQLAHLLGRIVLDGPAHLHQPQHALIVRIIAKACHRGGVQARHHGVTMTCRQPRRYRATMPSCDRARTPPRCYDTTHVDNTLSCPPARVHACRRADTAARDRAVVRSCLPRTVLSCQRATAPA
jgi:hypothetical protein